MKKTLGLIICMLVSLLVLLNVDKITDYLASFLENEKRVKIASNNSYYKNYDFKFVQESKTYVPYSYQGLLNIIFSTLNNGWDTFTFYCPDEYSDCLKDVTSISKDTTLLSNINSFVHPYNAYSKISIASSTTGEVTIKVTKLYSKEDIEKINNGVSEIMSKVIKKDMSDDDKLLALHDYIINNTRYDVDKKNISSYTALGPLYSGTAVCSGYADLMAIFISNLGLKNYKVTSSTHVWNAVLINGEWLHLDLTWDDPITKDSEVDTLQHDFFLVNTKKMQEFDTNDHKFNTLVYQELR